MWGPKSLDEICQVGQYGHTHLADVQRSSGQGEEAQPRQLLRTVSNWDDEHRPPLAALYDGGQGDLGSLGRSEHESHVSRFSRALRPRLATGKFLLVMPEQSLRVVRKP